MYLSYPSTYVPAMESHQSSSALHTTVLDQASTLRAREPDLAPYPSLLWELMVLEEIGKALVNYSSIIKLCGTPGVELFKEIIKPNKVLPNIIIINAWVGNLKATSCLLIRT